MENKDYLILTKGRAVCSYAHDSSLTNRPIESREYKVMVQKIVGKPA